MKYKKPLPRPNADTRLFWDGCKRHQLVFQKCPDCQHVRWPPSTLCPRCYSLSTELVPASGKGKIYTYTVYHQAFHESFKRDIPYVTAIVELDEGPHLLTNLVGCDHESIKCDLPVEVVWEDITEEFTLPKFRLMQNELSSVRLA